MALLCLLPIWLPAQVPDTTARSVPFGVVAPTSTDSARALPDTSSAGSASVSAAQDTIRTMGIPAALPVVRADSVMRARDEANSDQPPHSPGTALRRALMLPGWGQHYNRQAWKIPIVWGGLAGITYGALWANTRYKLYRHAYQWRAWEDRKSQQPVNPAERYHAEYDRLTNMHGRELDAVTLRNARDAFRRNRDLSYAGIGLFYGLTVLDAYVYGHLFDFDIDEQLSARVVPAPGVATVAFRWHF